MTCLSFSSCSNISAREVSRAAINLIEPFNRYQRTVRDWPLYWLLKPSAQVRPRIPALEFIFHSESRNHFHCKIMNFVYIFIANLNFQCWSLPEFWFEMLLAEIFYHAFSIFRTLDFQNFGFENFEFENFGFENFGFLEFLILRISDFRNRGWLSADIGGPKLAKKDGKLPHAVP